MRIDKWLWAVRLYKSRTIAADACKSGKIKVNDVAVKASYIIKEGLVLTIRKNNFNLVFKVNKLIPSRVGAPIAVTCYENLTPEHELNKFNEWYIGGAQSEFREKGTGRPTKRERRDIDSIKDPAFDWDDIED